MTEDDEAPAGPDNGPAEWQVNLIIALAVLALLHTFLIAVWIAPASRARDSLGGSSLTGYVNPYFTQAWSTLTPSSQQVDEAFLVRARIAGTGKPTATRWVDVTAEQEAMHGIAQARAHTAARRLATNMNAALLALPADTDDVVGKNHANAPASTDPAKNPVAKNLRRAGTSATATSRYARTEGMAVRYASLYAHARWGDDVTAVQLKIGIRNVPERSGGDTLAATDMDWTTIGWRAQYRGTTQARQAFDSFAGS